MNQNRQFDEVIHALNASRGSLDGARYDARDLHRRTLLYTCGPGCEIMTSLRP